MEIRHPAADVLAAPSPAAARPRPAGGPTAGAAAALGAAGVLFLLYPVLRPYSDETTLVGAQAMGSTSWLVSHLLAVAGFILLGLGIAALRPLLHDTAGGGLHRAAATATWLGVGLVLPYYGAETFGLHAVSALVLERDDPSLLGLADDIRYGAAAVVSFGGGLVLLAVGAVLLAAAVARSGVLSASAGLALAAGLTLFLPQFFTPPPARMAHGLLMLVGCAWLAFAAWRHRPEESRAPGSRAPGSRV